MNDAWMDGQTDEQVDDGWRDRQIDDMNGWMVR